jgi:hypothetical protein
VLDPKMEFKLSIDDTKAVEAGPDPVWVLLDLSIDWIVRMDPVGERVMDQSWASLYEPCQNVHLTKKEKNIPDSTDI